jgi:hypothetical protein
VLEAARCAEPDYAVAAAAGGVALARILGQRVSYVTSGSIRADTFGWPPEVAAVVQAPTLAALKRDKGVLYITSDDQLGSFLDTFLGRHRDLGSHATLAARFIDYAVMNALSHADDHAAFVAARRDRDLWVAIGDSGPGIGSRLGWPPGREQSALEFVTTRFDPASERGMGKLAALWAACKLMHVAEAVFASGDELRTLTNVGTNDTVLGGGGPTVLSVRL